MKKLAFATILTLAATGAGALTTQEMLSQLEGKCQTAIEANDSSGARSLTGPIQGWAKATKRRGELADYLHLFNGVFSDCVALGSGDTATFVENLAEYVTGAQEREWAQIDLHGAVNNKVHESCVKLARKDEVAAFTNALCVSSFKANGLPN